MKLINGNLYRVNKPFTVFSDRKIDGVCVYFPRKDEIFILISHELVDDIVRMILLFQKSLYRVSFYLINLEKIIESISNDD